MSDYSSHTVAQLKEILKERGLAVDGKKADLVQRLAEHDASAQNDAKTEDVAEPAPAPETAAAPQEAQAVPAEERKTEEAAEDKKKPEEPKPLSSEERKQLAVELLQKKIHRAEKFGDEASAEAAKKDLARIEKFGVEPGTALAKEIGLVDKSLNNGLSERAFKKHRSKKSKNHAR